MKKLLVLLIAVLALAGIGGAVAVASIPSGDGTINGCYKNSTGDLRVIDSAASCPSGYTALNWDQQADPVILTKQPVVSNNEHTLEAGSGVGQTAVCPAGSKVTGGGYAVPDQAPVRIVQSTPDQTFPPGGPLLDTWAVRVVADASTTFTLQVYAVCVSLT